MDELPAFGRNILPALVPTFKVYAKLHEANRSAIESTPREEHTYGQQHPRQKLDLYTPSSAITDTTPIVVFLYGGGLARGDKRMPSPPTAEGLVYANVGHYFSSHGFVTIIPDYNRTGEGASFPSGGTDISLALSWVCSHYPTGNHPLHIVANSAGAIHLSTYTLSPLFASSRSSLTSGSVVLKGAVLVSVPAHFQQAEASRNEPLRIYYGDRVEEDCAFGLLRRAEAAPSYKVLVVTGTLDPEGEICVPVEDFVREWKGKFGESGLEEVVLEGHNHFSTVAGLGTGVEREESLGTEVLKWIGEA